MSFLVSYKSEGKYYFKEKEGLKPNTVRLVDYSDERFKILITHAARTAPYTGYIKICLVGAEEEFFIREIEDISIYNELVIISWKV